MIILYHPLTSFIIIIILYHPLSSIIIPQNGGFLKGAVLAHILSHFFNFLIDAVRVDGVQWRLPWIKVPCFVERSIQFTTQFKKSVAVLGSGPSTRRHGEIVDGFIGAFDPAGLWSRTLS
jgi:hypothetical protein